MKIYYRIMISGTLSILLLVANSVIAANNNIATGIDQAVIQNSNPMLNSELSTQTPASSRIDDTPPEANSNNISRWIKLYRPTYALPFYYTGSPYQSIYDGNTPNNQSIQNKEFKAQLSFMVPVWEHMFNKPLSLNIAYTQLSYWQFYAESQYFRETNYEPEIFLNYQLTPNQQLAIGVDHQSNGRGGDLERSWNRAYLNYQFTGEHWFLNIRPWLLIFQDESSNLHNPDIAHYLGYGWIVGGYKFRNQMISLMIRNAIESGFQRGAEEINWSIPITSHFSIFAQFFSGYGQSLIEYNHYTNGIGIGIGLNNWF